MTEAPDPDLATLARRLSDAEAALERIELGTYDQCAACGRPIEMEVHTADPLADRCAACAAAPYGTEASAGGE